MDSRSKEPLVSVIMPIHNGALYLENTLRSLGAQTYKNCEFICIDDGSDDSSWDILRSFGSLDPRFHVLRQEPKGAASARNLGIEISQGSFLVFLDSDDIFYPTMLTQMADVMISSRCDVCVCDFVEFDCLSSKKKVIHCQESMPVSKSIETKELAHVFQLTSCASWNKMFRRDLIEGNGVRFQELSNTNDAFFVTSAIALATSIVFLDTPLLEYWINRGGSLQDGKARNARCPLQAAMRISDLFNTRPGVKPEHRRSLAVRCVALAVDSFEAGSSAMMPPQDLLVDIRSFFGLEDIASLSRRDFLSASAWLKYKAVLLGDENLLIRSFSSYGYSRQHSSIKKAKFAVQLLGILCLAKFKSILE